MSFSYKRHFYRRLKPGERFQRVTARLKVAWSLLKNGVPCGEWDTKSSNELKEKYEHGEINEKGHEKIVATPMSDCIKKQENLDTDGMHSDAPYQVDIVGDILEEIVVPCGIGAQPALPSPAGVHIGSGSNDTRISATTNQTAIASVTSVSHEFSGRTLLVHDTSLEPNISAAHRQSVPESEYTNTRDFSFSSGTGISRTSSRSSAETERIQPSILPCYDRIESTATTHRHMEGGVPPDDPARLTGAKDMPNGATRDIDYRHKCNAKAHGSHESLPTCAGSLVQNLEQSSVSCSALTPVESEFRCPAGTDHLIQTSQAANLDCLPYVKNEKQPRKPAPMLPHELWIPIISFLLSMSSNTLSPYMLSVPKWKDIAGLSSVSHYQRRIVLRFWVSTLILKTSNDISFLKQLGAANHFDALSLVKSILCYDSYQIYSARQKVLLDFSNVEELVLDAHSDIHFREAIAWPDPDDPGAAAIARPRMSYKNLWVKFPSSLKVLRLFHGHCPDIAIIRKAASDCPQLEVLTLGRCTMFTQNCCKFWDHLPSEEHDAYFSNTDVEDYAEAVGKELSKLTCLKIVHIHVYLTPFAAVEEHLHHSSQGDSTEPGDLSRWQDICPKCVEECQAATLATEKTASQILFSHVPGIQQVSWASFFSPGRTGWSDHYVNKA